MSASTPEIASLCPWPLCRASISTRLLWPDLRTTDHCRDHALAVWGGVPEHRRPVGFALLELGATVPLTRAQLGLPEPVASVQGVLL